MPISLTCTCGARLEFDDAFAGQVIPCPDCQRPLTAAPAAAPPSLVPASIAPSGDAPASNTLASRAPAQAVASAPAGSGVAPVPEAVARPDQRTSGLAMASLFLSLAGAFTFVGSLVGAGLGWLAIRRIDESREKLAGRQIARAGVILGLAFTFITGVLLLLKNPFGVDGLLRAVEWAGSLDYSPAASIGHTKNHPLSIERPASFGRVLLRDPNAVQRDDILLYSPYADAYLVCLAHYPNDDEELRDPTDRLKKALRLLEQSDMVRMILDGRIPVKGRGADAPARPEVPSFYREQFDEDKEETRADASWGICLFDVDLSGRTRTFLVYYAQVDSMLLVKAGVTRKERFAGIRPTLEKALNSILWQK